MCRSVWAVGALFDFIAGIQKRAPRWMLDYNLEWLHRFDGANAHVASLHCGQSFVCVAGNDAAIGLVAVGVILVSVQVMNNPANQTRI